MIEFAVVAFLSASCVGCGAVVLRALGLCDDLPRRELLVTCFAIGLGVTCWAGFFFALNGNLQTWGLTVLCAFGVPGLLVLKGRLRVVPIPTLDRAGWMLCAVIACVLTIDLFEGLSPPADADSLAYHFASPKLFLAAGRLVLIPRASDGLVPLFLQSTYLVPLGLGGERALTLWTMFSGWAASAMVYAVCRNWLERNWSLAVALVFLSTPTVLYGAGSGQLETRLALFVIGAALAVSRSLERNDPRWAVVAGLLAGFYAGSKYYGLVFVLVCGLALLPRRGWFVRAGIFSIVALVAAVQWYAWNWYQSGDPVFPVLFHALDLPDSALWTRRIDDMFRAVVKASENPIPVSLQNFIAFPLVATLDPPSQIDSGRVGLGPFGILVLPFAGIALWRSRPRHFTGLAVFAALVALFYAIWFLSGFPQRVRHLLPLYPLLLICLTVAAVRAASEPNLRRPLIAAFVLTIGLQAAVQGLFGISYVRHVTSGESRQAFLDRTVTKFSPVPWINASLGEDDRILVSERQLLYFIDKSVAYSLPALTAAIDLTLLASDPRAFLAQLRRADVTHVLYARTTSGASDREKSWIARLEDTMEDMVAVRCARLVTEIPARIIESRTMSRGRGSPIQFRVAALDDLGCPALFDRVRG